MTSTIRHEQLRSTYYPRAHYFKASLFEVCCLVDLSMNNRICVHMTVSVSFCMNPTTVVGEINENKLNERNIENRGPLFSSQKHHVPLLTVKTNDLVYKIKFYLKFIHYPEVLHSMYFKVKSDRA